MSLRHSFAGILLMFCLMFMITGCQATSSSNTSQANNGSTNGALVVYVTDNAVNVREKAEAYGLPVKTINPNSTDSELIKALLHAKTGQYFAIVNPVEEEYITGGAINDKVTPAQLDNLFRDLQLISKAGVSQLNRLQPSEPDHVRLAVFSDFQCPFCKRFDPMVENWKREFGNKLEVEWVDFPLPMHKYSFQAAEAAECARQLGQFEPYKEELFSEQDTLGDSSFVKIAQKLNLNKQTFSQCLVLHQERSAVRQDQYFGQYLGIHGTPSIFINGKLYFGVAPDEIEQHIRDILNNTPQPSTNATTSTSAPSNSQ